MLKRGLFILILILGLGIAESNAQCPMCRSAVESAMQNEGNKKGAGLNDGIMYLLAMPYLVVVSVGGLWWYNKKKKA